MIGLSIKSTKMVNSVVIKNISEIAYMNTSHSYGLKKIFEGPNANALLTQVAYCELEEGSIDIHSHETMDEYFYIISGSALFKIDDKEYECEEGTYICIPATIKHGFVVTKEIKMFYFGINKNIKVIL